MKKGNIIPFIGISIFIYILYRVGFTRILNSLKNINLKLIPLIILILVVYYFLASLKWYTILRTQNIKIKLTQAIKFYLIGNFYGFITPSRIGSLIRAKYVQELTNHKSVVGCSSSIVIERMFDIITIFLFAIPATLFLTKEFTNLFTEVIIIFTILLITIILIMKKESSKKIFKLLFKIVPNQYKQTLREAFYNFHETIPNFKKLILPFIITIITWFVSFTETFITSKAVGMQVPYLQFITFTSIATIIGLIPITMSGLGTREATWIILFKRYNTLPESIIAMSLLSLFIGAIIPSIIGFCLSLSHKRKTYNPPSPYENKKNEV